MTENISLTGDYSNQKIIFSTSKYNLIYLVMYNYNNKCQGSSYVFYIGRGCAIGSISKEDRPYHGWGEKYYLNYKAPKFAI